MPTHLKVIVIVRLVLHGTAHCPAKKKRTSVRLWLSEQNIKELTGINKAAAIDNREKPFNLRRQPRLS